MTPDQLSELSRFPAFPETARTLVRVAGYEAAAKLIARWPGQEPPVPSRRSIESGRARQVFDRLVDVIGEVAAWLIVDEFGGSELQIPNCKAVVYQHAQEIIRIKFDEMTTKGGWSYPAAVFELGIEFNLARRSVERILKRPGTGISVEAPRPRKQRIGSDRSARAKFEEQQGSLF
ncbi:hypothetical protein [Quatrionicoccus australiensis]|uniref:hypothetical protein n=1 Tax=Quatrionicoccus australiensis TaxID=138118 RepID=UPI001CF8C78F|nr:hypothetical protein [Quatrionicoccus australiensis]UCV13795.1 hypothetical protein KI612_12600 [Quatrionicoccus australiensis]